MYPANISGSNIALAAYNPAVYPAGPEPIITTSLTSLIQSPANQIGRTRLLNLYIDSSNYCLANL